MRSLDDPSSNSIEKKTEHHPRRKHFNTNGPETQHIQKSSCSPLTPIDFLHVDSDANSIMKYGYYNFIVLSKQKKSFVQRSHFHARYSRGPIAVSDLVPIGSDAVPTRFRRGSDAVPVRFRSGSDAVPTRFRRGSDAVPTRFRRGSDAVPTRFRRSSDPVPTRFPSEPPGVALESRRNRVGTESEPRRNRVGTASEPRRNRVGTESGTCWPQNGPP